MRPSWNALRQKLPNHCRPAKYLVEVHSGLVLTRGPIEVASQGLTAVRVTLNAGWIKIAARAARTGEALNDAFVTVARKDAAEGGETTSAEPIWIGRGENEIFVPAGTYLVRFDSGHLRSEQTVTLASGGHAVAEFTPALGTLELAAALVEGGPVSRDANFVITEDDPDAPQGRREIVRSAHPEPKLSLPAGTYYVAARLGAAEAHQRIAVVPAIRSNGHLYSARQISRYRRRSSRGLCPLALLYCTAFSRSMANRAKSPAALRHRQTSRSPPGDTA